MRYIIKQFITAPLRALAVLLLLCVVGLAAWYAVALRAPTPPAFVSDRSDSFDAQREYWQGRVEALGGAAAYKEFSDFALQNPVTARHQLAHAFGGALYAVEGAQGTAVCDAQFSYGCFHVTLGRAIADGGLSQVAELDGICRGSNLKGPAACEHGIGHGVVAYLGYEPDALDTSLDACDSLKIPNAALGCYSGVFMEYNMHTMLDVSAAPRSLVGDGLFAPCNTLASKYQNTCAFWQPQWWAHGVYASKEPNEALYKKIGELCDRIGGADAVRSCYEGLGYITPQSTGYSSAVSIMLCRASTTSLLNQLYCISYVAYVIGGEQTHTEGERACASLTSKEEMSFCLDYANARANMLVPKDPPVLPGV